MKKVLCILSLLLLHYFSIYAQIGSTDEQLASQYYQNGEFDKAAIYYEKLYKQRPNDFFYEAYLNSLTQLKDYKAAEKLCKRQLKIGPNKFKYSIDLGIIYRNDGNNSKAQQIFDDLVKKLSANQSTIIQVADAFVEKGEPEMALKTYEKGRKLIKTYPFNLDIAKVYGSLGRNEEMIAEYLTLLQINEGYLQTIQNALARSMSFVENSPQNQLLKQQLLKNIQRYPTKTVYAEMLIWVYIQQKDFANAFLQSKALDRRNKENGTRIISLAGLLTTNNEFELAINAYQYVIEKGKQEPYYQMAKKSLLKVMDKKITSNYDYTNNDLNTLNGLYRSAMDELGLNANTISVARAWANLYAYYLHKPDSAIKLLESVLKVPRITPQLKAECKLDLADILIIKGEIWDAALLYGQVDRAFKYDELGERAKFKNAKVSYYTGNFMWAKAQLDVLKGSTSKLIANDAMNLSMLITDNTGIDTTEYPMILFAKADLLLVQNKISEALTVLDSINLVYPNHALDDEILFLRHKIALKNKEYEKASAFLEKIIENYNYDILADNAVFTLAELQYYHFKNEEKAKELYQKLLFDFPGSLFVVEARKRFRKLRGDEIDNPEDPYFNN